MIYTNTFIKSKSQPDIQAMCDDFKNHLGPIQGSIATTTTNEDGTTTVVPAKGDPAYWYAIIRCSDLYVFPYNGIEEATQNECESVCGTWLTTKGPILGHV